MSLSRPFFPGDKSFHRKAVLSRARESVAKSYRIPPTTLLYSDGIHETTFWLTISSGKPNVFVCIWQQSVRARSELFRVTPLLYIPC